MPITYLLSCGLGYDRGRGLHELCRKRLMRVHANVLDMIGNTPMFRVDTLSRELPNFTIKAKAEWMKSTLN